MLIFQHLYIDQFDNILKEIRSNENFEIIKISRYKPHNIKSFVKKIYSHNYISNSQLSSKIKYLQNVPREVCFVFVKNIYPQEDYISIKNHRHIESLALRKFKEKLRVKYNPSKYNTITHNHVIHATDSELQTHKMLKLIGFKKGVYGFKKENKFLKLPYYIKDRSSFKFCMVDVDELYCNTIEGDSWDSFSIKTISIKDSPQYKGISKNMSIYENYIKKYLGGPLQEDYNLERYKNLVNNFEYLKEPFQSSFVITMKINNRQIIIDGLHRASCHIFNGNNKIKICQILK